MDTKKFINKNNIQRLKEQVIEELKKTIRCKLKRNKAKVYCIFIDVSNIVIEVENSAKLYPARIENSMLLVSLVASIYFNLLLKRIQRLMNMQNKYKKL